LQVNQLLLFDEMKHNTTRTTFRLGRTRDRW